MSNQRQDSDAAPPPADRQQHSRFYFDDSLITIEIEKTLFKVHKHQLMKSEVFADMFETAQGSTGEGSSADKPIVLEGVSATDFESLLTVIYAPRFSGDQLALDRSLIIPAFRLASKWRFKDIRTHLLPLVEKELNNVGKIVFAHEFGIDEWLVPAYVNLCRRTNPLTDREADKLGARSVLLIHRVREESFRDAAKGSCTLCSLDSRPHFASLTLRAAGVDTTARLCKTCKQSNCAFFHFCSLSESSVKRRIEKWVNDGCRFLD